MDKSYGNDETKKIKEQCLQLLKVCQCTCIIILYLFSLNSLCIINYVHVHALDKLTDLQSVMYNTSISSCIDVDTHCINIRLAFVSSVY